IVDVRRRVDGAQPRWVTEFDRDAKVFHHVDVAPQARSVVIADHKREARTDESALAADNPGPVGEIAEALPREFDFAGKGIMHPDERARTCGHTSTNAAFIDQLDSLPGARQMKRDATSDHAGADHDCIVI